MEILEIKPNINDAPHAMELQIAKGSIEFKNVHFTYQERVHYVLRGLPLTIKPGEYIALVALRVSLRPLFVV